MRARTPRISYRSGRKNVQLSKTGMPARSSPLLSRPVSQHVAVRSAYFPGQQILGDRATAACWPASPEPSRRASFPSYPIEALRCINVNRPTRIHDACPSKFIHDRNQCVVPPGICTICALDGQALAVADAERDFAANHAERFIPRVAVWWGLLPSGPAWKKSRSCRSRRQGQHRDASLATLSDRVRSWGETTNGCAVIQAPVLSGIDHQIHSQLACQPDSIDRMRELFSLIIARCLRPLLGFFACLDQAENDTASFSNERVASSRGRKAFAAAGPMSASSRKAMNPTCA